MKNLLIFLFLIPCIFLAQDQLTFNDILKIKNQDVFLKTVIEKGYSEGNSDGEKTYYGKGLSKDKTEATDWAEYTSLTAEFYFEQSNLEYYKVMKHSSTKNGSVNFTTYKCPGAKYKGYLGFAQVDGNGVIQLFPK
jgi:hypothetical protein